MSSDYQLKLERNRRAHRAYVARKKAYKMSLEQRLAQLEHAQQNVAMIRNENELLKTQIEYLEQKKQNENLKQNTRAVASPFTLSIPGARQEITLEQFMQSFQVPHTPISSSPLSREVAMTDLAAIFGNGQNDLSRRYS